MYCKLNLLSSISVVRLVSLSTRRTVNNAYQPISSSLNGKIWRRFKVEVPRRALLLIEQGVSALQGKSSSLSNRSKSTLSTLTFLDTKASQWRLGSLPYNSFVFFQETSRSFQNSGLERSPVSILLDVEGSPKGPSLTNRGQKTASNSCITLRQRFCYYCLWESYFENSSRDCSPTTSRPQILAFQTSPSSVE